MFRRSLLTRFGFGLLGSAAAVPAAAQSSSPAPWQAGRHPQDDWLDTVPGTHRFIVDAPTSEAFGRALLFLNNYYLSNEMSYGVKAADLAVVLVARHDSTVFGFGDPLWAKYGKAFSVRTQLMDPRTRQAPAVNVYNVIGNSPETQTLPNRGVVLNGLLARGMRLAVCEIASRSYSFTVTDGGATPDGVFADMQANLLMNARMVPNGVVTVARAQERGYALMTVA